MRTVGLIVPKNGSRWFPPDQLEAWVRFGAPPGSHRAGAQVDAPTNVPLAGDASAQSEAVAELDALGAGHWLPSAWACVLRARHSPSVADQVVELVRAAQILEGLGRRLEAAERVIDAAEIDLDRCGPDRLMAALHTARAAGAAWLVARAVTLMPSAGASDDARGADGPLTSRELEVAGLVAEGLTNREIAGQLYISIRTVTSHLDHIYTKLGLSSRDALADWYRSAHA